MNGPTGVFGGNFVKECADRLYKEASKTVRISSSPDRGDLAFNALLRSQIQAQARGLYDLVEQLHSSGDENFGFEVQDPNGGAVVRVSTGGAVVSLDSGKPAVTTSKLAPYSSNPACPKCSSDEMSVKHVVYCEGVPEGFESITKADEHCAQRGEHLHVKCPCCGYAWLMSCKS